MRGESNLERYYKLHYSIVDALTAPRLTGIAASLERLATPVRAVGSAVHTAVGSAVHTAVAGAIRIGASS